MDDRGPPKQAASPAQEATRARIASLEAQLGRLKKLGKKDKHVQIVEEELRKAHSKLRRLLNEAKRQRRRRERMKSVNGALYDLPHNDGIMTTLKTCTNFEDLVHELNTIGFTVSQNDDFTDDGETMPEVDGVKVEVELIEGDEEISAESKEDPSVLNGSTVLPQTFLPTLIVPGADHNNCDYQGESYRRWYEKQVEVQQQFEERLMREQMEMAKSLLESVTSTFVQGIQQVLTTITSMRRYPPSYNSDESTT